MRHPRSRRRRERLPRADYVAELAHLIAEESPLDRAWIEEFLRTGDPYYSRHFRLDRPDYALRAA